VSSPTEHCHALFYSSYPIVREEVSVGEKLNWRLPQHARSSRNADRFTGHERGLRNSKSLTIDKELSPLSVFMLYFTAVITQLWKRPVLVRSQTGDFHNMQEAAEISTDLLCMREA
jgi:hypothetical protein